MPRKLSFAHPATGETISVDWLDAGSPTDLDLDEITKAWDAKYQPAQPKPAPEFTVPPLDIQGREGYELPETHVGRPLAEPPAPEPSLFHRILGATGRAGDIVVGETGHALANLARENPELARHIAASQGITLTPEVLEDVDTGFRKIASGQSDFGTEVMNRALPEEAITAQMSVGDPLIDSLIAKSQHAAGAVRALGRTGLDLVRDPLTYAAGAGLLKKLGPKAVTFVDTAFALSMGSQLPESFARVKDLYAKEGFTPRTTEALADAVIGAGFTGAGVMGAYKGFKELPAPPRPTKEGAPARLGLEEPSTKMPADPRFVQDGVLTEEGISSIKNTQKAVDSIENAQAVEAQTAAKAAAREAKTAEREKLRAQKKIERSAIADAKEQFRLADKITNAQTAEQIRATARQEIAERRAEVQRLKAQEAVLRGQTAEDVLAARGRRPGLTEPQRAAEATAAAKLTDAETRAQEAPEVSKQLAEWRREVEAQLEIPEEQAGKLSLDQLAEALERKAKENDGGSSDVLEGADGEAPGNELGGGREAGAQEQVGARPEPLQAPARPEAEARPQTLEPPPELPQGNAGAGQASKPHLEIPPEVDAQLAELFRSDPPVATGEGPAVPAGGMQRRRELRPHIAAAVTKVAEGFQASGKTAPTRAEIVQELQNAGLRIGRNEGSKVAATRIQLAADEVQRMLGQREPRGAAGLPEPPTAPALPTPPQSTTGGEFEIRPSPKAGGRFEVLSEAGEVVSEHASRREAIAEAAKLNRGLPFEAPEGEAAPETRQDRLARAKSEQSAELAASMRRNLPAMGEEQLAPGLHGISLEEAGGVREAAAKSPAYRKVIEGTHLALQFLREELRDWLPEVEDKARGFFGVSRSTGNEFMGLTSQQKGGGFGPNPGELARRALATSDPVGAFQAEFAATVVHEFLHAVDKNTAHAEAPSNLSIEGAKVASGRAGLPEPPGLKPGQTHLTQQQKFDLLQRLVEKITDPAGAGVGVGRETGTVRTGEKLLSPLMDALLPDLSVKDLQELSALRSGGKAEGLAMEAGPKALPEPPGDLSAERPGEAGALNVKMISDAGKALRTLAREGGETAWVAYMNALVGRPSVVRNNLLSYGAKFLAGAINDAILSLPSANRRARGMERIRSINPIRIVTDMADTLKLMASDKLELSEPGKQMKAVRDYGAKALPGTGADKLPSPTLATFDQFSGDATKIGGAKFRDKVAHLLNIAGALSERQQTLTEVRIGLAPFLKKEGFAPGDYSAVIQRAARGGSFKERFDAALAQAQGDALAARFGRSPTNFERDGNAVAGLVNWFNKRSGLSKLVISQATGQPFPKALLANAFTDFVEATPGLNLASKRVRRGREYRALEAKAGKGLPLTRAERAQLNEFRSNAMYSPEGTTNLATTGPLVATLAMLYYLNNPTKLGPAQLPAGEDEHGSTWVKSLVGAAGSTMPHVLLGRWAAGRIRGEKPRETEAGRVPQDVTELAKAVSQQRGGSTTLLDLWETFTKEGADMATIQKAMDKIASDFGRVIVPYGSGGDVRRRPELPVKGERPGLDALIRGAQSQIPGQREKVQVGYDPFTGRQEPIRGDLFPEQNVSKLEEFVNFNKGLLPASGMLPKQTGEPSYDKAMFAFWEERLKNGTLDFRRASSPKNAYGRVLTERLTVKQLLEDPGLTDREKAEALQKTLPKWVQAAQNAAKRAVLGGLAAPPGAAEEGAERKGEEEATRKESGFVGPSRGVPAAGKPLKKYEQEKLKKKLLPAPPL